MREKGDERRKSDDKSAARKKREEWESKREERRERREKGSSKGSKGTRHQRGKQKGSERKMARGEAMWARPTNAGTPPRLACSTSSPSGNQVDGLPLVAVEQRFSP